jgi:hypothetical protein
MLDLIKRMDDTINRPYIKIQAKTEEDKKKVNQKQYKKLIEEAAKQTVWDNFDMVETGQDSCGHACPDTDTLADHVESWANDNLSPHKIRSLIVLNRLYKYEPSDMYLPDDYFFEKHEGIYNDCVDDIRDEAVKIAECAFWDSFPAND